MDLSILIHKPPKAKRFAVRTRLSPPHRYFDNVYAKKTRTNLMFGASDLKQVHVFMIPFRALAPLFLLSFMWTAAAQVPPSTEEFVGSTPCDTLSREFLGGLSTNTPCHFIAWRLTFSKSAGANEPNRFSVSATYWLPGRNDTNQVEEGPTVTGDGTWELLRGSKAKPDAPVYRLHGRKTPKPISLVQVGQNLLHFMNEDKTLRLGNAGWSYTLNRKGAGLEN